MSQQDNRLILHTYFRSSCSARLRIVMNLKGLKYESVYVNLLSGEQFGEKYGELNPSRLVPTLQHTKSGSETAVTLTQSMAILEYLEEEFPENTSLLPPRSDAAARATVRALANIVACDTQPPTNLRILTRITRLGGSKEDWAKELMHEGLAAYEKLASSTSGRFSYGDAITIADVCLVPAVWGALRFGVKLDGLPIVKRVYEEMSGHEAVKRAHWKNQGDTPEALRS
jgi:maleylacetoacetate isomerase